MLRPAALPSSVSWLPGLLVALLKFLVESNVIKASAFEEWLGQREASGEPLSEEVTALRAILPK